MDWMPHFPTYQLSFHFLFSVLPRRLTTLVSFLHTPVSSYFSIHLPETLLLLCFCCPLSLLHSWWCFQCLEPFLLKSPYFNLSLSPCSLFGPSHTTSNPASTLQWLAIFPKHSFDYIIPSSKLQRFPTDSAFSPSSLSTAPKHMTPTCLCTTVFHYSLTELCFRPPWASFLVCTLHSGLALWTSNLCSHIASAIRRYHAWLKALVSLSCKCLIIFEQGLSIFILHWVPQLCCWFCLLHIPIFTQVVSR